MDNEKFVPTVEWMEHNYAKLNKELFNGELGDCILRPFTTGKGSQGRTLGWFKITNRNIRVYRHNRKMFVDNGWDKKEINSMNFVDLCQPCIELNANYYWTEEAMQATLVHEMCHYYTYMDGYAPKQGHGREFKSIGYIVSQRSNGKFTIERLVSAEQMSNMELNAEMQAKKDKRLENKKSRANAVVVYKSDGRVELTTTSSESVIDTIVNYYKKHLESIKEIIRSNDPNLIDLLFANGYKKNFRTYRYWNIENRPVSAEIKNYDYTTILGDSTKEEKKEEPNITTPKPTEKRYFVLKLTNGEVFKAPGENFNTLYKAIQARFPNWQDDVILKLMNNPNYYEIMKENRNLDTIIENTLRKFLKEEMEIPMGEEDSVAIDPDMNLGLYSPLEVE